MTIDKYKHILNCNTFNEIIKHIKFLTTNNNISIFIQSLNCLNLCKLIDMLKEKIK